MNQEEQAMWGSHLPALLACIGASTGPVLELGIGYFSTPALHAICGALNRHLVSVEADSEWFKRFVRFASPKHYLRNDSYLEFLRAFDNGKHFGVAFIDFSPGGVARAKAFEALFRISSYVVVHDYHLENEDWIAPFKDKHNFTTWRVFNTQQPPTLVASFNCELPECCDQL